MITKMLLIGSLLAGMAPAQTPSTNPSANPSANPSTNPSTNDEKPIRQLVADFVAAWNKHDAHGFAETFTEDADFTNVRGDSAHGRKAVEDFHAPMFATRFKNTHLTADDIKIRFLSSDIASVDVQWEMTGALDSDGTTIPIRKGLLNWAVTRHGDRWLIAVMHNQEFTPRKP